MKETKFKQTEFGIIPGDWEECTLRELIDVLTDFTANGSFESLAQNVKYLEKPSYARLIRLTDIRTNFANDGIYVSKESYNFLKKSYLEGGELLLANVGAYAGYSFIYPKNLSFRGTLGPNMFLIKFFNQKIDNMFAYYAFSHGIVFNQLVSKAASSDQPKLNKEDVRTCFVHIPSSLTEQKNIAQTLSDVDAVISTTEKLIAKKKNIKQGAMQQLLTGKKRLPGFGTDERTGSRPTDERRKECHSERSTKREVEESSGYKMTELGMIPSDWEVKTLNELCECNRSSTLSLPKEFVYVDLESVCQGKLLKRQIVKACDAPSRAQRFFEKGDILYQTVRPYQKNNLKVDFDAKNFIASTGYAVLHCKEFLLNSGYLYQYIHTDKFVDMVMDNCSGTSYPAINPKTLMTFNIIVPSSIVEQTAIAKVLCDMDTEISALETKLAKYRTLKTGMMQQLLTGKVRLI